MVRFRDPMGRVMRLGQYTTPVAAGFVEQASPTAPHPPDEADHPRQVASGPPPPVPTPPRRSAGARRASLATSSTSNAGSQQVAGVDASTGAGRDEVIRGYVFDPAKLNHAMQIRGLDGKTLAELAAVSKNTVSAALHRRPVTFRTRRQITDVLLSHPPLRMSEDLIAHPSR